MSSSSRAFAAALMFALMVGAYPPGLHAAEPDEADRAAAQELFAAGMELRDKGDHKGSLAKFTLAYKLVPSPITALELGREYLALGKLVEARERFIASAKMPPKPSESASAKAARTEADRLAKDLLPRIPVLVFNVAGATPTSIKLDDEELALDAEGTPRGPVRANPGKHRITARASGVPDLDLVVTLKESEKRDVDLEFETSAARVSKPATRDVPPESRTSTWTYVGFSAATIGLVGGIVAIAQVNGIKGRCTSTKSGFPWDSYECVPGSGDSASLTTWQSVFYGSLVVTIVGVGAGVYGLTTATTIPNKTATAPRFTGWISWRAAGITGAF